MTTAIFDIGKTNKKFFLFDEHFQEVYTTQTQLAETLDDDGYLGDDLNALSQWMHDTLQNTLAKGFNIQALNFSTYGASLVHLNKYGKAVTPLYNYTKPFPSELESQFYQHYGDEHQFARQTASPKLGMLNSGWQLYWLKVQKPHLFGAIQTTLHLPQYCSFRFIQKPFTEYTSLGCHTALWDFEAKDYHKWVYQEQFDQKFPPIVPTYTTTPANIHGKTMNVGVGIHDSSAALLPYLLGSDEPFLLISTGTWSISLNPFNQEPLTPTELQQDCLNFLRPDGQPVKAARLFLGHEYQLQVDVLCLHFKKAKGYDRNVAFDQSLATRLQNRPKPAFKFQAIPNPENAPTETDLSQFASFEEAYHRLMIELVSLQVQAINLAKGNTSLRRIYIDGGFVNNSVFIKLLAAQLPNYELLTAKQALGSALGAAMAAHHPAIPANFLADAIRL